MKNYKQFNENKLPKIKKGIKEILKPFKENEIDIFDTFNLDKQNFNIKDYIENLYNNADFNHKIEKKGLKKGKLQDTKYNEVLLYDRYVLRFFFIYKKDAIEIEEPKFILVQYYDKKKNILSSIKLYKNKNNTQDFYEDLTDATIEIEKGDDNFIYKTSNSGNNWELKNPKDVQGDFKDSLDKTEIKKILKDKNTKVSK